MVVEQIVVGAIAPVFAAQDIGARRRRIDGRWRQLWLRLGRLRLGLREKGNQQSGCEHAPSIMPYCGRRTGSRLPFATSVRRAKASRVPRYANVTISSSPKQPEHPVESFLPRPLQVVDPIEGVDPISIPSPLLECEPVPIDGDLDASRGARSGIELRRDVSIAIGVRRERVLEQEAQLVLRRHGDDTQGRRIEVSPPGVGSYAAGACQESSSAAAPPASLDRGPADCRRADSFGPPAARRRRA